MIDRFDRKTFEAALPKAGPHNPLWLALGLRGGEHCYLIAVRPGVLIYVRSSVRADDLAADTAADSIRCWLAADDTGRPLGSKDSRWISRVPGWQARLTETLRKLWKLGHQSRPCPNCLTQMGVFKVKKSGPNKGRWFLSCPACGYWDRWVEAEPKPKQVPQQAA
jgi:hypothetical protein